MNSETQLIIAQATEQGWHVELTFNSYPTDIRRAGFSEDFIVWVHIWHQDTEIHERGDFSQSCWEKGLADLLTTARKHLL